MVQTAYITSSTGNTTLDYSFDTYIIDASGGNITLTLPNITANGIVYNLVRIDLSSNIVSITGTGGQLINSASTITINSSSDMSVRSLNSAWVATFGGGSGRGKQEFRLSVVANNGNNFLSFTNAAYSAVASFIYRGSTYYGGTPKLWKIIYNTTNTNSTFLIRINDLTNNTEIIVGTISWTTAVANQTIITFTTFGNIPTGESIWQIEIRRTAGSGSLNFYASHLEF